jgi:HAD superfamily hydrolase (TIGR01549 family)
VGTQGEVTGVLLDVDGTLVDTNYLHATCWAEAFAQHGIEVATARVHALIGMESSRLVEEIGGPVEELQAAHRALYAQFRGHLRPLPGSRALLEALHRDHRVVLASSASQDELTVLEQALDAADWIDGATSGDDVASGKPAPDLLQQGLELLGTDDAVMIGDSVWDGEAAERAGLPFIALLCGGTSEQALTAAGAAEVWSDPRHLVEHLPKSILQKGRRP